MRPGTAALSLLAGLVLGGGWLGISFGFLSQARSADVTRSLADRIHIDLLECRRREKDFLLRSLSDSKFYAEGTTSFLQLHQEALARLTRESEELQDHVPAEDAAKVKNLLERRRDYEESFRFLVAGYRRLGFKTWGIEGRLREGARGLQDAVEASGRPELQRDFLLLNALQSDFLLLEDEATLSALLKRVDRLRASIPAGSAASLEERLDRYLKDLSDYRSAARDVGLNENLGLQAKFRAAAHDIEPIVAQLVDRANGRYRTSLGRLVAGLAVAALLLTALLSTTFFLTRSAQSRSRELGATAEALSRSNDELQQFAYVASHDLQEPLRAIAGCAGILKERCAGQLDERAQKLLGYTIDGVVRMQTLIDDLLALSSAGDDVKSAVGTDSGAALQAAMDNLSVAIRESGAAITRDSLPAVDMDPTSLLQVFQNLLGNAIKFRGPQPPLIHVAAQRQEGRWRFSVRDNGIGIEPQYFDKIFRVFQRLHSRLDYPGSGIGLAICRKILVRHGGEIWLESELNKGTTFYFTIPDRIEKK